MAFFVEPLQYQFFVHGLIAALLVGCLCGLLGVYIVLRQMSYIGHGLSHAVFGGAVVSHLLGVHVYVGAGLWGFGAAVLIQRLTTRRDLHADAVIGIVTTASFAVGVALMSRVHRFTQDFEAVLFGNVLGVSEHDLLLIAGVTGLTGLAVTALYKQLLFSTFDEAVAQVAGVPTRLVYLLFACILALAILASMQVLGVTLIAATIVIPAATAVCSRTVFPHASAVNGPGWRDGPRRDVSELLRGHCLWGQYRPVRCPALRGGAEYQEVDASGKVRCPLPVSRGTTCLNGSLHAAGPVRRAGGRLRLWRCQRVAQLLRPVRRPSEQLSCGIVEPEPGRLVALIRPLPAPNPQLQGWAPEPATGIWCHGLIAGFQV